MKISQTADFRFVIGHHPPITAVGRRQSDNAYMTALIPMFEKYKLTAGFFGHDHNYQHFLQNGIHYYITGGGGAPLYPVDNAASRDHAEGRQHRKLRDRPGGRQKSPDRSETPRRLPDRRNGNRPLKPAYCTEFRYAVRFATSFALANIGHATPACFIRWNICGP